MRPLWLTLAFVLLTGVTSTKANACAEDIPPSQLVCMLAGNGDLLVRGEIVDHAGPDGDKHIQRLEILRNDTDGATVPDDAFVANVAATSAYVSRDGPRVGDIFLFMFSDGELVFTVEEDREFVYREGEPVRTEVYTRAIFETPARCRAILVENGARERRGSFCCATSSSESALPFAALGLFIVALRRGRSSLQSKRRRRA